MLLALMAGDAFGAVELGHKGVMPGGSAAAAGRTARARAGRAEARGAASTTTKADQAPAPGRYDVSGTVSSLSAGQATGPLIPTPMLITVPVRGVGSGYFYNVTVTDPPGDTVYWDTGEPLGLIGRGALDLGRADVTVTPSGATWYLDGAERRIEPGSYEAAAPVAVGTSGLASPEPDAEFTAGPESVLVTAGGATIRRPSGPLHLVGPGALRISGSLIVASRSGTTRDSGLDLADGAYVVQLSPDSAGLSIQATVQGKVTLRPAS